MYGYPNQTRVTALTKDEAIEQILGRRIPAHFPDQIELAVFKRHSVSATGLNPLEQLLDNLDEEYGDPDDTTPTEPPGRMKQAEPAFLEVVLAEYQPWCLVQASTETIDVTEWLKHNPGKFPDAGQRSTPA